MSLYTEEEAVSRLNTIPAIRGSSLCVADSELLCVLAKCYCGQWAKNGKKCPINIRVFFCTITSILG